MTQSVNEAVLTEQVCMESHLPPDTKAAALLVAFKTWHLEALQRDHFKLLRNLYPLLHQFSQLTAEQQQQVTSRFAFIYALKARSEQQQLADALCQAVLWQRYEQLCHCLKAGDSNVRLDALCWGYQLRRQLPWQLAVPALLNNVCDKIFDVDLSLGLAWWLLIYAGKEPLLFMKTFAPEQRLLLRQYDDRIAELMPKVNVHVSELAKIAADQQSRN